MLPGAVYVLRIFFTVAIQQHETSLAKYFEFISKSKHDEVANGEGKD
jgi:hypothetical protein